MILRSKRWWSDVAKLRPLRSKLFSLEIITNEAPAVPLTRLPAMIARASSAAGRQNVVPFVNLLDRNYV